MSKRTETKLTVLVTVTTPEAGLLGKVVAGLTITPFGSWLVKFGRVLLWRRLFSVNLVHSSGPGPCVPGPVM